jgi:4-hydroxy-L-threonine phosphate dehydrogenase PdxA
MKRPLIAITMGDPAGIGPEIIIKAYTHNLPRHIPVISGDMTLLKKTALNLSASICLEKASTPDAAIMKNNKGINIVPQGEEWIVERLGKFSRTLTPGLNLIVPYIDAVRKKSPPEISY